MKVTLRSTENKVINIPSKVWKEAGWKLGDRVMVVICENMNGEDTWKSISIDRVEDEWKFDEEIV